MSVVTAHMVYFCAFIRSDIFPKNARKLGVGRGQFDAGVNGLKLTTDQVLVFNWIMGSCQVNLL